MKEGDAAAYPDDGHIFVCVRVRDAPTNASLLSSGGAESPTAAVTTGAGASSRSPTIIKKVNLREMQKICVSVVENILVMHDPKSVHDAVAVAKDGNHVVQVLTNRANGNTVGAGASNGRPSRKSSGTAAPRTSSRRTAGGRPTHLTSTGTANYYECDHCIVSMEAAQMLKMPLIQNSDFLQPPPYSTQEEVYRCAAQPAVAAAVDGINSCVFAYGQTGSGKTYTLFGNASSMRRDPGIVPRALNDLFGRLEGVKASYSRDATTDYSFHVQLSFFEIYQNEVFCLFSRQGPLHVQFSRDVSGTKETMVINDLQQQTVTSAKAAYPLIEMGLRRRQTSETGMNTRSSRSHAIVQVRVTQYRTNRTTKETVELHATLNLVDLAGSERQPTAQAQGKSREEGIQINQSLATLARVINDIARGAKFVNYRDSLLTMVLKDNLGGNSKTFMIATVSPVAFSFSESCATLAYVRDVRKVRNRPMVNRTFQTRANLLELNTRLQQENEQLKEQMGEWMRQLQKTGGGPMAGSQPTTPCKMFDATGLSPIQSSPSPSAFTADAAMLTSTSTLAANEALLSATTAGLTAPLLVLSHRQYTTLAGLGGSCIDGGIVRVTSLVKDTQQFSLRAIMEQTARLKERETTPYCGAESIRPPVVMSATGAVGGELDEKQPAEQTDGDDRGAAAVPDLGSVYVERVAQRSCAVAYYLSFKPPESPVGMAHIVDLQVNGKSFGSRTRWELRHGDVVSAYLEQPVSPEAATGGRYTSVSQGQCLIAFHYVDLSCLSRSSMGLSSGNTGTLGQLAVSVDIPEDTEHLSLEGIKQLQRDNAKLLDLVQQQAETIEYNAQRESMHRLSRGLQSPSLVQSFDGSESPNPRSLSYSSSADPQPEVTHCATLEAFRRLSRSPLIRAGSALPADADAGHYLRQAAAQSLSQQRLASAVRENEVLHKAVVSRNAALEALAERLAEFEAGESIGRSRSSSVAEEAEEGDDPLISFTAPVIAAQVEFTVSRETSQAVRSLICVSPFSAERIEESPNLQCMETNRKSNTKEEGDDQIGDGKVRQAYENTEGTRVRYQAVVRERERLDRIQELEDVIESVHQQLSELESRLHIANDETLEHQRMREGAETERDALLKELVQLRAENVELRNDITTLETFLSKDEQALAEAARIGEEELDRLTAGLTQQITVLKVVAQLWKRRAMKYIEMYYGATPVSAVSGEEGAHLDSIPRDDLCAAGTVAIVKRRLGAGCSPEMEQRAEQFEGETAVENLKAWKYDILDFDQEKQRPLEGLRRIQTELQRYKNLMKRLHMEKESMLLDLEGATDATEEERQRMEKALSAKDDQLLGVEESLLDAQNCLLELANLCDDNMDKVVRSNELLLSQQKWRTDALEAERARLINLLVVKDEELRNLTRSAEDSDGCSGATGTVKEMKLRHRIEGLITDSLADNESSNTYHAFPSDFEFSEEIVALIRVCLRMLLNRLKMEMYVLNRQNLHKFSLLIPSVQLRPEAQFHTFMHELRGIVSEMAGRPQRIGGKWTLSKSDILSGLLDHRRRRAVGALNGLLIWYDHWDLSPKTEHACYMELIRNADHIMQMARLIRRESFFNTNATSTALMSIPGKKSSSNASMLSTTMRKKDKTVQESCRILSRLDSTARQSYLARAVAQFTSTPFKARVAGVDGSADATTFSRSATATDLALSQSMIPFCSSSSAKPPTSSISVTPTRPISSTAATTPSTLPGAAHQRGPVHCRSSTCVLPASEDDVNYVATTSVAEADSLNAYHYGRRMSPTAVSAIPSKNLPERMQQPLTLFSRCHTTVPGPTEPLQRQETVSKAKRVKVKPAAVASAYGRSRSLYTMPLCVHEASQWNSSRLHDTGRRSDSSGLTSPKPRTSTASSCLCQFQKTLAAARPQDCGKTTGEWTLSSFYNPAVLKSLRERSTSDVNSSPHGGKSKNAVRTGAPSVSAKTKRSKAMGVKGGTSELARFRPTRTRGRISAGNAELRLSTSTLSDEQVGPSPP